MENGEAKKGIKCQTGTAEKVTQKHSSLSDGVKGTREADTWGRQGKPGTPEETERRGHWAR